MMLRARRQEFALDCFDVELFVVSVELEDLSHSAQYDVVIRGTGHRAARI